MNDGTKQTVPSFMIEGGLRRENQTLDNLFPEAWMKQDEFRKRLSSAVVYIPELLQNFISNYRHSMYFYIQHETFKAPFSSLGENQFEAFCSVK